MLFQKSACVQTRPSPLKIIWRKIENVFPSDFQLLFVFFRFQTRNASLYLKNPSTPGGSSIWTLEYHCIFFRPSTWTFYLIFCSVDTCVMSRKMRDLSQKYDACEILDLRLLERYHMFEKLRPGFFNSLPARCSGSPVRIQLFCFFLLLLHFPAVLSLILYDPFFQRPWVGAEGTFSTNVKSNVLSNDHPILDPWSFILDFTKLGEKCQMCSNILFWKSFFERAKSGRKIAEMLSSERCKGLQMS